ncbi:hypothetical protein O181_090998 [Austropuccinia psidii MF-1]|uniref:Reverse transcriptase domain-containing protein n=1 Tax=Austropuccinia psidii MF-1 TaxID=1389203 RepID=A0A9Q3P729_9BASI|nr:hypothetical protein [Austropuccinia psidii MF-1]
MLRRPPYPESPETRKEIEKCVNELLDMDVVRKIGHNEVVEITTLVLITWNDVKSRLCGDFRALKNYTKADRYLIPRIPHALDKLAKAKYIKMDCIKGFHRNAVKQNSIKLLRIMCDMGIYELTRMPFCIKNYPSLEFLRSTTVKKAILLENNQVTIIILIIVVVIIVNQMKIIAPRAFNSAHHHYYSIVNPCIPHFKPLLSSKQLF